MNIENIAQRSSHNKHQWKNIKNKTTDMKLCHLSSNIFHSMKIDRGPGGINRKGYQDYQI